MASLLEKIWKKHLVACGNNEPDLLYIDRHLIHEVTSPQAFAALKKAGRSLRRPDLTFAVIDHSIPTDDRTRPLKDPIAENQLATLEKNQKEFGVKVFFGDTDPRQGVIHVTMPEQGITLPGHTVVCGDSHTATHGAFGAIAFGIGTSEVEHVLATQTLYQAKPKEILVEVCGTLPKMVSAKDLILHIINKLGVAGGVGSAIEYAGSTIRGLSMESRMTISNMSIECGAKLGLIAPDDTTFEYVKGRPFSPKGEDWEAALSYWKTLFTDQGHKFSQVLKIKAEEVAPRITWGTNPAQSVNIDEVVPSPQSFENSEERLAAEKALNYMGLKPNQKFSEIKVDYVFIGSCTNGRIEDLRDAAAILKGKKITPGLTALIVPGSGLVKKQAEDEGLAEIFIKAGAQWREAGCSMCLGMNPDLVPEGLRCVSSSNRNFEGRQGRGARTHLASPTLAAASAICGFMADPRKI